MSRVAHSGSRKVGCQTQNGLTPDAPTEFAKQIPLGRVADVYELSDVITFLASPAAGDINGGIIHVDGGRTAV